VLQQNAAAQLDELRAICFARGWEIVGEFVEQASGADVNRPELACALAVLRAGRAKTLVAVSLDRVSRSLAHLLQLAEILSSYGAELVCTRDGDLDTSTPMGKAFFQMRGVFAEFERALAGERSREFAAVRKAQGLPNGRPSTMTAAAVARAVVLRGEPGPPPWSFIAHQLRAEGHGDIHPATVSRRVTEALRNPPTEATA
jgi:DNA invertase Pin-like site-specific DNA recombinase